MTKFVEIGFFNKLSEFGPVSSETAGTPNGPLEVQISSSHKIELRDLIATMVEKMVKGDGAGGWNNKTPYLSDYAKKGDVYSKQDTYSVSQVDDKFNNLSIPSIEGLASEEWVRQQDYLTQKEFGEYPVSATTKPSIPTCIVTQGSSGGFSIDNGVARIGRITFIPYRVYVLTISFGNVESIDVTYMPIPVIGVPTSDITIVGGPKFTIGVTDFGYYVAKEAGDILHQTYPCIANPPHFGLQVFNAMSNQANIEEGEKLGNRYINKMTFKATTDSGSSGSGIAVSKVYIPEALANSSGYKPIATNLAFITNDKVIVHGSNYSTVLSSESNGKSLTISGVFNKITL